MVWIFLVLGKITHLTAMDAVQEPQQSIEYLDEEDEGDEDEETLRTKHQQAQDREKKTELLYRYLQDTHSRREYLSARRIRKFIRQGANVNGTPLGMPLFEMIIKRIITSSQEAKECIKTVEYFLEHQVDPNIQTTDSTYPLQWTNELYTFDLEVHKKIIALLCNKGANPALRYGNGRNAFFVEPRAHIIPYRADFIKNIRHINRIEIMRHYLTRLGEDDPQRGKEYVRRSKPWTVSKRLITFGCALNRCKEEVAAYNVPVEVIRYIASFMPEEINYPQTVEKILEHCSLEELQEQLPALFATCPHSWIRQSLRQLDKKEGSKSHFISNQLRTYYLQKAEEILSIPDDRGKLAKDSHPDVALLLDPDRVEENFGKEIDTMMYETVLA